MDGDNEGGHVVSQQSNRRPPARTVLEHLLRCQDRTYEETATWFEQTAIGLGERATITARHLRRLASGERQGTTPVTRRVLQAMFGQPAVVLLAASNDTTHAVSSLMSSQPIQPRDREILEMAAARARNFTLSASTSNLSGEGMDQLHDDVAVLAVSYQQRPLPELLGSLVETQDAIFTLLEGRQPPKYTRHLLLLAGVTSGILAKVSHDLGDSYTALTQSRTAFLCADNADHNGMRAWIRGLQSLIAYWAGRHHEAVRYAQQGAQYATHNSTRAWLPVSEARAWAAMGNVGAALAAIENAADARDQIEPDEIDELGGVCTFSHGRQLYYAADALSWLPSEAHSAERYALEALTHYEDTTAPGWAFGDAAGAATNLAIARIARNEYAGADEALQPVFALLPEQRINGVVLSINRVHRALVSGESSATTALQERIESYASVPARALIR